MIQYLYLGRVDYDEGLRLQAEIAELVGAGHLHNVLLLLEHPPVLTLGRNAGRANILASDDLLARRGIAVHQTKRGGDVTYHGPGQLVGYPIFDLRTLRNPSGNRMGPVDFVRGMEEALIRLCGCFGLRAGRIPGLTGVWCPPADGSSLVETCDIERKSVERKIAAIGIHVARGITSHGFAFNATTYLDDFALIVPCGIATHPVTSLKQELLARTASGPVSLPSMEELAHQTARQFSRVFGEQVLAVESLEALHAQATAVSAVEPENPTAHPTFLPAEDTPMQIPAEVQRLKSGKNPPARA